MSSTRNHLAIMILGIAIVSLTTAKTCPYVDENCSCVNTSVSCSNLQKVPPLKTGSDVIAVSTLKFDDGNLTSIPGNSLPPGLVEIDIEENPLTDISEDAFLTSANTLNVLSITSAQFKQLPDALLKLTNLTDLKIMFMNIEDWNNATLQHIATSLRSLVFQDVGLYEWPTWLSFFHSLNKLSMDAAQINNIPDDAFNSMKQTLNEFSVQENGLTKVPTALSVLQNLTSLALGGTKLSDVNGRPGIEQLTLLPCASKLLSLNVGNMLLSAIPNFSSLRNLMTLDLRLNVINEITSDMLPPNLVDLTLSENSITEITDISFTKPSRIETLYLAYNPISTISVSAFNNLVSLRNLDLTETRLIQIPQALLSLSSLKTLDMSGISALLCPCPPQSEWKRWYALYNCSLTFFGDCSNQGTIAAYFSGMCQTHSSTTQAPTCPTGDAASLAGSVWLQIYLTAFIVGCMTFSILT